MVNLTKIPVYVDEAIFISYANMVKENTGLAYISMQEGKTPLFIWIVSKTLPFFPDPLFSARIISVFSGLGTMLCLYLLLRFIGQKKVALFFLLLYSLLPFGFIIERLAFVDSLLVFFSTLSLLLLFLSLNSEFYILYSILAALSLGLAFYTKTSARLFFIVFLISSLLVSLKYLKNLKLFFKNLISLGLFSFIYLQSVDILRTASSRFWSMVSEKENDLTFSFREIVKNPINISVQKNFVLLQDYLFYYITPVLLIILVIGIIATLTKKYKSLLPILTIFITVLFGVILSAKLFASRYAYLSYPFLVIIISVGLSYIHDKFSKIIFILILIMSLTMPIFIDLSILFSKNPTLASQDKKLLICQGMSGHGITEAVEYLKPVLKKEKVTLYVDYLWGIPEIFSLYAKSPNLTVLNYYDKPGTTKQILENSKNNKTFLFFQVLQRHKDAAIFDKIKFKTRLYLPRPPCDPTDIPIPSQLIEITPSST